MTMSQCLHDLSSFSSSLSAKTIRAQKAEDALKFPYNATLERLEHRRNMKHYGRDNIRILMNLSWNVKESISCCSEDVEILYSAIHSTICALGPLVLSAIYFVGPKLSKEIVRSPVFCNLFKLMSTSGRLLNDIQTFKGIKGGKIECCVNTDES
ncbi:hypothetical protein LWI28_024274 [Acer negundo]|uniref:Uncharacterized protein n=1 Tax=Acer negundo TaxID=4023 RepID=A0AAD5IFX3_ACENE|nr:hypothetical protein LWI28_024274 [Acer negundo]